MPMPGFADPVIAAQSAFRAVMDAFARPGRIVALSAPLDGPKPLARGTAAIALTLFDHDSPVWIDAADHGEVAEWIRFHTGAPMVANANACSFAVITDAAELPAFDRFNAGTDEYPDRSATLIIQVDTLEQGPPIHVSGPGIRDQQMIAPAPVPADLAERLTLNRELFPRGLDLLFVCDDRMVGLPRSVRVNGGR
jgi:alpha-D-ribose 1-methylphosphonate 5-triphosphate synthase subunit PhnH